MKTIIFLGTPQMSADLLEEIIKDNKYKVVGVISQPDKPLGRKKILTPSPVSMVALKYNIPLHRPEKLNNDYEFIERLQPDLLLTFAYGQLISTKVLSLSKYQALNLHGSLLPKYRGAAPIQYALKNGDKKTGVCLMAIFSSESSSFNVSCRKVLMSPFAFTQSSLLPITQIRKSSA